MERVRRNERIAVLTKTLTENPNRIYTLSHFCEIFATAKSTMSEDMDILRQVMQDYGYGTLETVTGAAGGVRFRPGTPPKAALSFVQGLCSDLAQDSRLLPGGFLYLSDILSAPALVRRMGVILAGQFASATPDFVLTMETKGIPVGLMTADALGVPLIIARRSSKVYEGSAVNINYLTGSAGTIETMSLNRRAVQEGQRALIVDDFLKAGGTAKGMVDLMKEFAVEVVGTAFVMSTAHPAQKRIQGEKALMVMDVEGSDPGVLHITPAPWLAKQAAE